MSELNADEMEQREQEAMDRHYSDLEHRIEHVDQGSAKLGTELLKRMEVVETIVSKLASLQDSRHQDLKERIEAVESEFLRLSLEISGQLEPLKRSLGDAEELLNGKILGEVLASLGKRITKLENRAFGGEHDL